MSIIDETMSVMDAAVAAEIGWIAYPDGGGRWTDRGRPTELFEALSEGLTGTAAGLRAIAIRNARRHAVTVAESEKTAADKNLHAARVTRQAEIVAARSRGLSWDEINQILQ